MKLNVTQENLAKAVGTVGRVVSSRSSLPVLSNILLSTDTKRLRLAATNLEIGVTCWIGCKVEQEGAVTAPARLLSEFVSNLPPGNLEIAASEANITVTTPHYNSQINGISAEEFPVIPQVKSDPVVTLPAEVLRDAIAEVVIAASPDENRPVLAGVYMYIEDDRLILVATDSYRLAERSIALPKEHASQFAVVVPARTMQELARILSDNEGDVSMYIADNQVMFQLENIELVSRLIEGQFPNYRQIIPEEEKTVATLPTAELSRITKMANLFARENAGSIRVEVQAEGEIRIMSSASQVGENTSSADCDVAGDDGEISLNARYLSDALSTIKTKQVSLAMSGKLNPCVLRPEDPEGEEASEADDYIHIIMPLRT
jgi:DNA polymerase-3 subunit beta